MHPKWFEDIGGFLEEGNLPLFVKFCETVVKEFSKYVTHWVTFNEPAVVCVTGYWFGLFPPGVHSNICVVCLLYCCCSLALVLVVEWLLDVPLCSVLFIWNFGSVLLSGPRLSISSCLSLWQGMCRAYGIGSQH